VSTPPPQQPYGQQPPYAQYPYQQPYPQGHYPAYGQPPQAGWPVPPPLPPQRNSGKVIAVVVGAIVFFTVGGAGLLVALHDRATRAEYRLSVPSSLEDGKYTLQQDISSKLDSEMPVRDGEGGHDLHGSGGAYRSTAGGADELMVSGVYGTIDDPDTARQNVLEGTQSSAIVTGVAVPAKTITPAGSTEPLSCEVVTTHVGVRDLPTPVCAWADSGTVSIVMRMSAANLTVSPDSIDLNAFAGEVNWIRDEVRVKL
jgi:hypothetical protein